MSIISDRTTIYNRDGSIATLPAEQARYRVYMSPGEWSLTPPPPPGWDREVPRYRLTRDLQPASRARYRTEPPFESMSNNDCWQYGERPLVAGEEIESTAWPHLSMRGLTFGAEKILQFLNGTMKSRLALAPWRQGRIRLESGIGGSPVLTDVRPPPVPPFNTRPAA
jgi:hypothetical protein